MVTGSSPSLLDDVRLLIERERRAANTHTSWASDVIGSALGVSRIGDPFVTMYVETKRLERDVESVRRIPRRLFLPSHRASVATRVEQRRRCVLQRQVTAGDPIAHVGGGAGSVGIGVQSKDGKALVLSCAHVLAPSTLIHRSTEDVISSPPILHSSSVANRIAVLHSFVPFENTNTIDAATCELDAGNSVSLGIVAGEQVRGPWRPSLSAGVLPRRHVWRVDKDGQRVDGEIVGVENHDVFMADDDLWVSFASVLHYKAPNSGGDSGSAVIDAISGELIGIHFAGDGGDVSLMCLAFLAFDTLKLAEL